MSGLGSGKEAWVAFARAVARGNGVSAMTVSRLVRLALTSGTPC